MAEGFRRPEICWGVWLNPQRIRKKKEKKKKSSSSSNRGVEGKRTSWLVLYVDIYRNIRHCVATAAGRKEDEQHTKKKKQKEKEKKEIYGSRRDEAPAGRGRRFNLIQWCWRRKEQEEEEASNFLAALESKSLNTFCSRARPTCVKKSILTGRFE